MLPALVINDLHLGVQRTGGTTAESAQALRQWLLDQYRRLLYLTPRNGLCIVNGDLTDRFDIPLGDALDLWQITARFLHEREDACVVWAQGNHDLSKDSSKMGTVSFLANLLSVTCPHQFDLINSPKMVCDIYVIPHVINQQEFDKALQEVPYDAKYLLLHCNYDSPFAEHADHSLNLSRGQAKTLIERGIKMVLGHEHHPREAFGGKVFITGNQFPSSVSDCVTPEGKVVSEKRAIVLSDNGIELVPTWHADDEGGFAEVNWKDLRDGVDLARKHFIRVTGAAEPEEAAEALRLISRLRQSSDAFVITNGVKVSTRQDGVEDVAASIEDVRKVDVVSMLLDALTPAQRTVVQGILEKNK